MLVQEIGVDSDSTIRYVDRACLSTKQLVECARCFKSAVHNNKIKKRMQHHFNSAGEWINLKNQSDSFASHFGSHFVGPN